METKDIIAELEKIDAERDKKRESLKGSLVSAFQKDLVATLASLEALKKGGWDVEVLSRPEIGTLLEFFSLPKGKKGKRKTGGTVGKFDLEKGKAELANGEMKLTDWATKLGVSTQTAYNNIKASDAFRIRKADKDNPRSTVYVFLKK